MKILSLISKIRKNKMKINKKEKKENGVVVTVNNNVEGKRKNEKKEIVICNRKEGKEKKQEKEESKKRESPSDERLLALSLLSYVYFLFFLKVLRCSFYIFSTFIFFFFFTLTLEMKHFEKLQRVEAASTVSGMSSSPSNSSYAITSPLLKGICSIYSLNPCVPEANCYPSVPIVGDAVCVCPEGFDGDGRKNGGGCVNIDECVSNKHTCDTKTQNCVDTYGSFRCDCKPGYTIAPNNKTCLDIDECQIPHLNTCPEETTVCRNLEGSFRCDCINKFHFADPITGQCRDMNECEDMGGAMNPCKQICIDKVNGVDCACYDGWYLEENGTNCVDVDECHEKKHTCDPSGKISLCINTEGSYRCECSNNHGYTNGADGKTCVNLDECRAYPNICGGPNSCCKDLAPPQKYACVVPVQTGLMGSLTGNGLGGGGNSNAVGAMGNSVASLLGGISGMGNGGMTATSIQRAFSTPPQSFSPSIMPPSHSNYIPSVPLYKSEFVNSEEYMRFGPIMPVGAFGGKIENENFETPIGVPTIISSPLLHQISSQCFEHNVEYLEEEENNFFLKDKTTTSQSALPDKNFFLVEKLNRRLQFSSRQMERVESATRCQILCQASDHCDFFSYNTKLKICFFKLFFNSKKTSFGYISGPKFCPTTGSSTMFPPGIISFLAGEKTASSKNAFVGRKLHNEHLRNVMSQNKWKQDQGAKEKEIKEKNEEEIRNKKEKKFDITQYNNSFPFYSKKKYYIPYILLLNSSNATLENETELNGYKSKEPHLQYDDRKIYDNLHLLFNKNASSLNKTLNSSRFFPIVDNYNNDFSELQMTYNEKSLLSNVNAPLLSEAEISNLCDDAEFVCIVAGEMSFFEIHDYLRSRINWILSSHNSTEDIRMYRESEVPLNSSEKSNHMKNEAHSVFFNIPLKTNLEKIEKNSISSNITGDKNNTTINKKQKNIKNEERRLQILNSGVIGPRLTSTISSRAYQCPPGFELSANIQRSNARLNTLKNLQQVLTSGAVNPDGSTGTVTPEALTNAVVRSTNTAATEFSKWYTGLSNVSGEVANAAAGQMNNNLAGANSLYTPTANGNMLNPFVDSNGAVAQVREGNFVSTLNNSQLGKTISRNPILFTTGGAIASGILAAGIQKKLSGGGPAESKLYDRTGKSKFMAYGLKDRSK